MSKQNIKLNHCLRQKNVNVGQPGNPQLKLLVNIEDKFLLLLKHSKGENPCMERNAFTALVLGNWGLVRNTTQACFTFVVGTGTAARGAPGCYWSGISSNTGRKHWLMGKLQVGWGGYCNEASGRPQQGCWKRGWRQELTCKPAGRSSYFNCRKFSWDSRDRSSRSRAQEQPVQRLGSPPVPGLRSKARLARSLHTHTVGRVPSGGQSLLT